jgi:predicted enzyme related to lactoylglutathione lyase
MTQIMIVFDLLKFRSFDAWPPKEVEMHVKFAPLPVFDQQRAVAFYTKHLGCKMVVDRPYKDDGWRWIELGFEGADTTLQLEQRPNDMPSAVPILVLVVRNVDEIVKAMHTQGIEIITEPQEAPWDNGRRFAEFRDSEGNRIVIGTN